MINADVIEDKMEESEDKDAILGNDMVNPFTGERACSFYELEWDRGISELLALLCVSKWVLVLLKHATM